MLIFRTEFQLERTLVNFSCGNNAIACNTYSYSVAGFGQGTIVCLRISRWSFACITIINALERISCSVTVVENKKDVVPTSG